MPPDQPEQEPVPPKRHRRPRSLSMTQPQEALDLTGSPEPETNGSRKHDRHEQDSQADGPSKRAKMQRTSEPPSRKDTSTTPRTKDKKTRKKVNPRKASRTNNYQEVKKSNETLQREWKAAKQEIRNMKHEIESKGGPAELKRLRERCDRTSREKKEQHSAFQEACQKTDEKLRAKTEAIADKQKELDRKTNEAATYKRERDEMKLSLETANRKLDNKTTEAANYKVSLEIADKKLAFLRKILTCKAREHDKVKERLEKSEQEVEGLHTINDKNGSWNHKITEKEQKTKETLKNLRTEHRKTISNLKAENCELIDDFNELNGNLQTQENWYNEKIAGLQRQLQDSHPQSQRFNFKVPDDKVTRDFTALGSKIRQFVFKHTRPVRTPIDEELRPVWPSWSPALRNFLASPILCNLVFEAFIWEHLLVRVFTPWSEVWAGELGQSLENVLSMAGVESERAGFESETYAHYQYLRSSSSSFIRRLNGEHFRPKDFESAVDAMFSTLGELRGLHEVTDATKADALGIFGCARDFEIQLRKSKSAYSFCMNKALPSGEVLKHGLLFDHGIMIDRSPDPSDEEHGRIPAVDFIMSPGLHKRGNNDGDEYEKGTWLIKMGVVCDAARFFLDPGRFTAPNPFLPQTPKALHSDEVMPKDKDQHIVLQSHASSTQSEINTVTPISDSAYVKLEDTDSKTTLSPSSTPGLTSACPAPRSDKYSLRPTPKKASSSAVEFCERRV